MEIKNHALLFISLLLLCSTLRSVASSMNPLPLNLSTDLTLTNNYNPEILNFWDKHAQSSHFQGVDNKTVQTISIVTGNEKVVVISQGRNESVLKYKEIAYDLHQQGYDIFLIDHRGQGFSERFGGDQYRGYVANFQDYVDDFHQYVHSLQLEKKYSGRYLLSHSMGGTISALYLQQFKHPFQASIFFSPMFSINFGSRPTFLVKIVTYSSAEICRWFNSKACYVPAGKAYVNRPFKGNQVTHSQVRFNSAQAGFTAFPETQLGDATMRWVATSISATEQAIENAHKINIPVLIVQAGKDSIVTSVGQKAFFEKLTPCQLNEFLTLEEAKHELLLERDDLRSRALTHVFTFINATTRNQKTCTK